MKLAPAVLALLLFAGCAHNQQLIDDKKSPHATASSVSSSMPSAADVSETKNYSPEMKRKLALAETLKKTQVEVYELQDRVYGNTEYGSMGLYGALRECQLGTRAWTEPLDRVADRETTLPALDDPAQLAVVTEASLVERQKRFEGYLGALGKRQDDLEDKLEICRGEMKVHRKNEVVPSPSYIQHDRENDVQEAL